MPSFAKHPRTRYRERRHYRFLQLLTLDCIAQLSSNFRDVVRLLGRKRPGRFWQRLIQLTRVVQMNSGVKSILVWCLCKAMFSASLTSWIKLHC
jgi:hypothetical protein